MPELIKKETKKVEKFITEGKFNELSESVSQLVGLVKDSLKTTEDLKTKIEAKVTDPVIVAHEKEIATAGPKPYNAVNPEWEELAQKIIGEAVDHCEVDHLRSGGLMFTVVIKKEFSNAPDAYWSMYKSDRRTKEVGNGGIAAVEDWCKLIAQNLKRGKSYVSSN